LLGVSIRVSLLEVRSISTYVPGKQVGVLALVCLAHG
jgi:ethanolamine utilization microcompartment shell protein EutS